MSVSLIHGRERLGGHLGTKSKSVLRELLLISGLEHTSGSVNHASIKIYGI